MSESKDEKEEKNKIESLDHQLEDVLKSNNITVSAEETELVKKLLLADLAKIEQIKAAFKADPNLTKIARTKGRTGKNRENYDSTEQEKILNLNFSVVRSRDEKTKKETICILLEGRGVNKYDIYGNRIDTSGKIVGKELGKGGYGLVKLALATDTLEVGAVKISELLPKKHATGKEKEDERRKNIFRDSAVADHAVASELGRTWGGAETPSNFPETMGKHYSFMKRFPGIELTTGIGRDLNLTTKLNMAFNAAMSLKSVHDAGFIHRDVKFDNYIYDPKTMDVNIIDFGSAIKATKKDQTLIGQSTSLGGTRVYRDPNLQPTEGKYTFSSKSDIYSLGIVYFFLFYHAGERPTEQDTNTLNDLLKTCRNAGNQITDGIRQSLERIRKQELKEEDVNQIARLISSMMTKMEDDRPNFPAIFESLANAFIQHIKNITKNNAEQIKDYLHTPLFDYIAKHYPKKLETFKSTSTEAISSTLETKAVSSEPQFHLPQFEAKKEQRRETKQDQERVEKKEQPKPS